MTAARRCPDCGAELPANSPENLCPKCLLQAGLASQGSSQPELERTAATPPASGFIPPPPEELARRFPQLEVLELLGKGGMGAVYKAKQQGLDRMVALKILPPEVAGDPAFAERFTREARALAKLNHPSIVGVYDFGQTEGLYYFIMEYVDGTNLRQIIQAHTLTPKDALAIVPQICDALQYAHDEGVVHRDIKPENILLDKKGRAKIADFGLVKLLGQEQAEAHLTGTHQVMGTLRYMAPEQMEGSRQVDHRADIYSLGVVFYELLTGELPLGRFAPPSKKVQIDVRLDEIVLKTLEKEPEHRYQHASEVKTEVEALSRAPAAVAVPVAVPDEHPLLKGLRFWMTPQPGYGRWVGIPMLIIIGIVLAAVTTIALVVPQQQEWVHMLSLCGGVGLIGVSLLGLHLLWVVNGRQPEIIAGTNSRRRLWTRLIPFGLVVAVAVAAFVSPWWSTDTAASGIWSEAGKSHAYRLGLLPDVASFEAGKIADDKSRKTTLLIFVRSMDNKREALLNVQLPSLDAKWRDKAEPLSWHEGSMTTANDLATWLKNEAALDIDRPEVMAEIEQLHALLIRWRYVAPRGWPMFENSARQTLTHFGYFKPSRAEWKLFPAWLLFVVIGLATTVLILSLVQLSGRARTALTPGVVAVPPAAEAARIGSIPLAAKLAVLCLGLALLTPTFLFMLGGSIYAVSQTLRIGLALAMLLGLLSIRHPLGRYSMLAAVLVLGCFSAVQIYMHKPVIPIVYPHFGDTGFVQGPDGPMLGAALQAKLGIPPGQAREANAIFQKYYKEYLALERRHTKYTRDDNGHVYITIEPFVDEMYVLAQRLQAELGGVVDQRIAPPPPEKGKVHVNIGLFRHAGEATVSAELWKDAHGLQGHTYFMKESIQWADGSSAGGRGYSGWSSAAFPDEYRLYWTEPGQ